MPLTHLSPLDLTAPSRQSPGPRAPRGWIIPARLTGLTRRAQRDVLLPIPALPGHLIPLVMPILAGIYKNP